MQNIGKIDVEKYSVISPGIRTDEVVLTPNRQEHIIEVRGLEFYERYRPYFQSVIENPDYISKDKERAHTAIVCKKIELNNEQLNIVVRLAFQGDEEGFKNSIITAMHENEKRFNQRLRNNSPLYKRE